MAKKTRQRSIGGLGARPPLLGPPQFRPLQGSETRPNPEGGYSTEITMTDRTPGGHWMVYPSLWMGSQGPVELPGKEAQRQAGLYEQFGYQFPRFPDLASSEAWAVKRSKRGGTGLGPLARPVKGRKKKRRVGGLGASAEDIAYRPDQTVPSMPYRNDLPNPPLQPQLPEGWMPPGADFNRPIEPTGPVYRPPPPVQYRLAPRAYRVNPRANWRDIEI